MEFILGLQSDLIHDLIAIPTSPKSIILNLSIFSFLISTVSYLHDKLLLPPPEGEEQHLKFSFANNLVLSVSKALLFL